MKKIVLFVLMIIASVNLFSNELPDDIYYYHVMSINIRNKVLEDIKHNNNIIELNDGYYLGMFDDDILRHITYKVKVDKNSKREVLVVLNKECIYHIVNFQIESLSGLLLTSCNIRVFNKEDTLIYEGDYYAEDDNIIHECHFDPKTYTYYNEYE